MLITMVCLVVLKGGFYRWQKLYFIILLSKSTGDVQEHCPIFLYGS